MSARERPPRVHFSFRSPYSWMAMTELARRLPDVDDRVEFIPYWDPDEWTAQALRDSGAEFHYVQMSKAKHLYILYDTRRQAQRLGLRMRWPVDDDPWWELPHLAWLRARELGKGRAFYNAVVATRWERGEDVCSAAVIRSLAEEVGLPGEDLMRAPESERLRAEGGRCLVRAYEDDVFGVPYFRTGRHRFWGLDRVNDFIDELTGLRTHPGQQHVPAAVAENVGAYDTDTAGGCG